VGLGRAVSRRAAKKIASEAAQPFWIGSMIDVYFLN
jgi:hypothetical protein